MELDFNGFAQEICRLVPDHLPIKYRGSRIRIEEKRKNNDLVLHGIAILPEGMSAIPLIYLENYYGRYINEGRDPDDLAQDIVDLFCKHMPEVADIKIPDLSFRSVKDLLRVRLINSRSNPELLSELVSRPVGCGFSLTAYIDLPSGSGVSGMIQVTRELAAKNGYDETLVINNAVWNSSVRDPARLTDITEMLYGNEDSDLLKEGTITDRSHPLVLSNKSGELGAAALFYPGMMKKISEITGGDYYVLPSSVHELIILPDSSELDSGRLMETVLKVNRFMLGIEEKLCDRVFLYRSDIDRLIVAEDMEKDRDQDMERA
ncbi:MAG: hypothetical protein J5744_09605 [Oscillospiraceae bacterium]|nr:hypothetical protein [Oscillospiraceae bacterium]